MNPGFCHSVGCSPAAVLMHPRDVANTQFIRPGDQVSFRKLAMFDNNIAMRRSCCITCCQKSEN